MMGISPQQAICMDDDSSDWLLQGTTPEDNTKMDIQYSSSPAMISTSGTEDQMVVMTCSTVMNSTRVLSRPQHEQSPNCPRCESTHTKFCYYNNYSLSQPRYFCKTCRRYWTKGGNLRNIPVGGGCRKNNKKQVVVVVSTTNSSSKNIKIKPSSVPITNNSFSRSPLILNNQLQNINISNDHFHDHQLMGFPADHQMHFSLLSAASNPMSFLLENNNHHDHESTRIHEFMDQNININSNFGGVVHNNVNYILDHESNCLQRSTLMVLPPYDDHESYNHEDQDVKPPINYNAGNILSLELLHHDIADHHQQQQGANCNNSDGNYNNFGGGLGSSSWTGLMNGYGSSATNPLLFN